jgi:hypothetical protein
VTDLPLHLLTRREFASLALLGDQSSEGEPDPGSIPAQHRDTLVSLGLLTAPNTGHLHLTTVGWQFLIDHT